MVQDLRFMGSSIASVAFLDSINAATLLEKTSQPFLNSPSTVVSTSELLLVDSQGGPLELQLILPSRHKRQNCSHPEGKSKLMDN